MRSRGGRRPIPLSDARTPSVRLSPGPEVRSGPLAVRRAWIRRRVRRPLGRTLVARFGWSTARVAVAEIARWRIEGPWRWITAIGVRRSIRHGDLTFGGSPRGGVRLDFREPIRLGFLSVPALYLTVQDLEGFAAALAELGIPGEDARTGSTA